MRETENLLPIVLTLILGFVLVTAVLLKVDMASAEEVALQAKELKCALPNAKKCALAIQATALHRRTIGAKRAMLDESDQLAALRSIQFALSNVGDGASYIWQRGNGRLSAVIQPTESFKDDQGRVCRHIIVRFTAGDFTRGIETVACRRDSGVWVISG